MPDIAKYADFGPTRRGADGRVESQEARAAQWRIFRSAHGIVVVPAHGAEGIACRLKVDAGRRPTLDRCACRGDALVLRFQEWLQLIEGSNIEEARPDLRVVFFHIR